MNKIKNKLDDYLGFNSDLLFNIKVYNELKETPFSGYRKIEMEPIVRVFGGAIRDILADMPIHDIDILVGPKTLFYIEQFLSNTDWIKTDILSGKDMNSIYKDVKIISEPNTWIKTIKGEVRIIQLIRPVTKKEFYIDRMVQSLIQNVDISCCGVSYDGKKLYENYPNAVLHCLNRSFLVNKEGHMYSYNRTENRKWKLVRRGWKFLDDIADIRDYKISNLLEEHEKISYIEEFTKDHYDLHR